jgi:hypothetical protein
VRPRARGCTERLLCTAPSVACPQSDRGWRIYPDALCRDVCDPQPAAPGLHHRPERRRTVRAVVLCLHSEFPQRDLFAGGRGSSYIQLRQNQGDFGPGRREAAAYAGYGRPAQKPAVAPAAGGFCAGAGCRPVLAKSGGAVQKRAPPGGAPRARFPAPSLAHETDTVDTRDTADTLYFAFVPPHNASGRHE